jgi:hypothetical protein
MEEGKLSQRKKERRNGQANTQKRKLKEPLEPENNLVYPETVIEPSGYLVAVVRLT